MKDLSLIINFFSRNDELERTFQQKWAEWLYKSDIQTELKKRGIGNKKEGIIGIRRGQREIDPKSGKETIYVDLSGKGIILKDKLKQIKNSSTNEEHYADYIIYIDGDGDIDFDMIFKVLDVLVDTNSSGSCFLCRKGKYMMGNSRDNIERFENYLLENKYGVSLPDAQCGCWGIRKDILDRGYDLTAKGFDIELDIISMILDIDIIPHFIPTTLTLSEPSKVSSFAEPVHRQKLTFIIEKLGLTKNILMALYRNFTIEHPDFLLPLDYMNLLQDITSLPLQRKLPPCKEKGICNRCDLL